MGDGSGGDGGGGSDGSGTASVTDNDATGTATGSIGSLSGFGDNASLSDAGLSDAATSGLATGLSGVSTTGFGNFGPTSPGSLGIGVGYGGVSGVSGEAPSDASGNSLGSGFGGAGFGALGGGFGAPGTAGSITGPSGTGGIGISGPGNVSSNSISNAGSFGIGVGSDADNGFGVVGTGPTASSFGLGPDNSLGITSAQNEDLNQASQAALGTLADLGDFDAAMGVTSSPATAVAQTASPSFNEQFGFQTPNTESPAVSAINAAINDSIGPQAPSFSIPGPSTPTDAELGISSIGKSPAESIQDAQTALAAQNNQPPSVAVNNPAATTASFQGFSPSPPGVTGVSPSITTGFQGFSPSPEAPTQAPIAAPVSPQEAIPGPAPTPALSAPAPAQGPAPAPGSPPVAAPTGGTEFANLLAAYPGLQQLLAQLSASGYRA